MAKEIRRYDCAYDTQNHKGLVLAKYYSARSGIYENLGHLPICKECFEKKFNEYSAELHSPTLAMRKMCRIFDLYFNEKMFLDCGQSIGKYFRNLNLSQSSAKSYDDYIHESGNSSEIGSLPPVQEDEEIDQRLISRWGGGLEAVDYDTLESHYNYLKSANPNCDSNQEIFIVDLCYAKMQQNRAVREGKTDDYIKLSDSYRKTFTQAGLKTVRENAEDKEVLLGVTTEIIEKYTPAEYYKNKKLYKDMDGIGDYAERFIFRPIRNLMFGTKDRDKEFCVKDENEDMGGDSDE